MFQVLLEAQERGIEITRMPTVYEELINRIPVHSLEADWILRTFVDQARVSGFYDLGKRVFDILGSLVGIFILLLFLSLWEQSLGGQLMYSLPDGLQMEDTEKIQIGFSIIISIR